MAENSKFTKADLRKLGDISIMTGMLYWQESEDLGTHENQLCILVAQAKKLNELALDILLRGI